MRRAARLCRDAGRRWRAALYRSHPRFEESTSEVALGLDLADKDSVERWSRPAPTLAADHDCFDYAEVNAGSCIPDSFHQESAGGFEKTIAVNGWRTFAISTCIGQARDEIHRVYWFHLRTPRRR